MLEPVEHLLLREIGKKLFQHTAVEIGLVQVCCERIPRRDIDRI